MTPATAVSAVAPATAASSARATPAGDCGRNSQGAAPADAFAALLEALGGDADAGLEPAAQGEAAQADAVLEAAGGADGEAAADEAALHAGGALPVLAATPPPAAPEAGELTAWLAGIASAQPEAAAASGGPGSAFAAPAPALAGDPTSTARPNRPARSDALAAIELPVAAEAPAAAAAPQTAREGFAAALAAAAPAHAEAQAAPASATPPGLQALAASAATGGAGAAPGPSAFPVLHQAALPSQPLDAPFAGDLAAEVRVMVEGGLQQAELHLNPADLGPIRIQLAIRDQSADISFAAAHATTREGIEQSLPALREMLAEQGLSLGQAGVDAGAQQQFADAKAQREAGDATPRAAGRPAQGQDDAPGRGPAAPARRLPAGRGMLDLYA